MGGDHLSISPSPHPSGSRLTRRARARQLGIRNYLSQRSQRGAKGERRGDIPVPHSPKTGGWKTPSSLSLFSRSLIFRSRSRSRSRLWGMWARHASPLRIGGLENPPSVNSCSGEAGSLCVSLRSLRELIPNPVHPVHRCFKFDHDVSLSTLPSPLSSSLSPNS